MSESLALASCLPLPPPPPTPDPLLSRNPLPGALIKLLSFSCKVVLDSFAAPWAVARQVPLSMGFPRQKYWSDLTLSSPGDLASPRIEPESPALAERFFTTKPSNYPTQTSRSRVYTPITSFTGLHSLGHYPPALDTPGPGTGQQGTPSPPHNPLKSLNQPIPSCLPFFVHSFLWQPQ